MGVPRPSAPQGRLEDAPLASVLAWARDARATGCVTLRAATGVSRLYLSEGRPAGVVLAAGYRPLPQLLLELGWIDELALDRALEEVYGGVPLERALVNTGALTEAKLQEVLALQEARNLEVLGNITSGEVEFKAEPLPPTAQVRLSPERALLDALSLPSGVARTQVLLAELGTLAARRLSAFDVAAPALQLKPDEIEACAHLTEALTTAEFLERSKLPEVRARALLAVLIELELVEIVDRAAEESARAEKAKAERAAAARQILEAEGAARSHDGARLLRDVSEVLEHFEGEQLVLEEGHVEARAAREAWRTEAAAVDAATPVMEHASVWLAEHEAFAGEIAARTEAEIERVTSTEARGIELEGLRQAHERARRQAEAEEQARLEAEAKARAEAEEQARLEAEAKARAEAEEQARREAEAKARAEAEAKARAEAEEQARLEADAKARAEAEAKARAEAEEQAQHQAELERQEEIGRLVAKARAERDKTAPFDSPFAPVSLDAVDRQAMLAARAHVEEQQRAVRAEVLRRAQREEAKEAAPALPPNPTPEQQQREIQRQFELQAKQWLREEQHEGFEPDDEPASPQSLAASIQASIKDGVTTDLESLLTASLRPPVRGARPQSTSPNVTGARPLTPPGARAAAQAQQRPGSTSARSVGTAPPSTGARAPAAPPKVEAARPQSSGASRDKLEFSFDSFGAAGSGDSADVESIWDDPEGDDMGNDEEAKARRARLRRLGMANTGILQARGSEQSAAAPSPATPGATTVPPAARPATPAATTVPPAARPPTPAARPPTGNPAASARPGSGPTSPASRPPTGGTPLTTSASIASAPAPSGPAEEAKLGKEIEARYARLKTEDHFSRLGVSRSATPQQVKQAFVELAKRFHPDKLPASQQSLADKNREVFSAIRESYDLLQNDKARAEYVSRLARPPTPQVKAQGNPRQVSGEAQLEARKLRVMAEMALKKKSFMEAEGLFAKSFSIEHSANDLAAQAWCMYLDPARRGELSQVQQLLRQAFAIDAGAERAHYVSGVIARAANDLDKAEHHFRAALKTNPNSNEASLELRVIERRKGKGPDAPPAKKKGFFDR